MSDRLKLKLLGGACLLFFTLWLWKSISLNWNDGFTFDVPNTNIKLQIVVGPLGIVFGRRVTIPVPAGPAAPARNKVAPQSQPTEKK